MNLINLITGEGYEIITFPDGEKHLKLGELNRKEQVYIKCRITNSDDLFILMQLSDVLRRQEVEVYSLEIWYLMGMRCDRLFSLNEPFSLKIIADVVNSFNALYVNIVEPHSDKTNYLIDNVDNVRVMDNTVEVLLLHGYTACMPDEGAARRYSVNNGILCGKERDVETGKLKKFFIKSSPVIASKIVVYDDLCDGGGTFIGIAELLKKEYNPKELVLVVTHAVQMAGIKRVAEVYDKVYISNSYKDWHLSEDLPLNVEVVKV